MSTNRNILTSPVGSIHFMAAEKPVKSTNDKMVYTIRIAFDSKKDAAFLKQIAEINDAKVVTEKTYRGKSEATKAILSGGKSLVSANSNFKPMVFDSEGNEIENAPMFFADSKGTAQMMVQPFVGGKGGTINLVGIKIHDITTTEGTGETTDRESRLAQLRAAAKAETE